MFFIFVRRFGISQFLLCKMQETLKKKNVFSYEILWKLVEADSDQNVSEHFSIRLTQNVFDFSSYILGFSMAWEDI